MDTPDIIGFELSEAVKILEDLGLEVGSVKITTPPRQKDLRIRDSYRVVRITKSENGLFELLVCDTRSIATE